MKTSPFMTLRVDCLNRWR